MKNWKSIILELQETLYHLSAHDRFSNEIEPDDAFEIWKERTLLLHNQRRTVYLIGNGASASMASHVSADLAKNALIHTEVFSDLSLITAIANDLSYEEVFAEPLRRRMLGGDMLVAISSSGKSPNILRAVKEARFLGGTIITLSAMEEDNEIRRLGDLNFHIPALTYGLAETCHAAILHHWIDIVAQAKPIALAREIWLCEKNIVSN